VEFDQGINSAVKRLRDALLESAEKPRYIETLARRGYRFIGTVEQVSEPVSPVAVNVPNIITPGTADSRRPLRPALTPRTTLLVLVAVAVAVAGYVQFVRDRRSDAASEQRIVPFTSDPGVETMPVFSPDGRQVAYVKTERDPARWRGFWKVFPGPTSVYIKAVEAGTELRLTRGLASDSFPAWSPDGQYVVFHRRTSSGDFGYYFLSALGGPEHRITAAASGSGGLAWFPDGKRLAVAEVSESSRSSPLFAISIETGERRALTTPTNAIDIYPAFSPDGKWLAFVRAVDFSNGDIYLLSLSSGDFRRLTFDKTWKRSIAWAPDSREILYSSERFWRIPIEGGAPRAIAMGDQMIGKIAVAPHGNRLAYVSYTATASLWRMDLAPSGSLKRPTRTEFAPSTRDQDDPQYSPDGRRIAFLSGRSGTYEIWTADANGDNLMRLTDLKHTGSPAWSPDGTEIAFDTRINGNPDIWAVHADGGAPRRITERLDEDVVPSWSHDGKWIYFASNRSGTFQIWKAQAAGESPSQPAVQVTSGGGFHAIETGDGKYLYFRKGRGQPGLWRLAIGDHAGSHVEAVMPSLQPWGWWTLAQSGLFFFERNGNITSLMLSGLAGGARRQLAEFPEQIEETTPAITVSADGRHVVYTQSKPESADIILVENFR
jgi:Tol biopolymer transport system component